MLVLIKYLLICFQVNYIFDLLIIEPLIIFDLLSSLLYNYFSFHLYHQKIYFYHLQSKNLNLH